MPKCDRSANEAVAVGVTLQVMFIQEGRTLGCKPARPKDGPEPSLSNFILIAMSDLGFPVALGDNAFDRVRTIRSCPLLPNDLVLVELAPAP